MTQYTKEFREQAILLSDEIGAKKAADERNCRTEGSSGKETETSQKHGRFCFRKYMKSWMSILIIIITESTGFCWL